jgi:hypothetical protein
VVVLSVKLNADMEQLDVDKVKFDNIKPVPVPKANGYQDQMKGVKTSGVKIRGAGAAKKGFIARGPQG